MKFKSLALALTLTLISTGAARAHVTQPIQELSDPAANQFLSAAKFVDTSDPEGTARAAYQIQKFSPARAGGEGNGAFAIRLLKALLHRDYPITGDEGGYSLSLISGSNAEKQIQSAVNMEFEDDAEQVVVAALKAAVQAKLVVIAGSGNGNNTSAVIFAVVDPKTNELAYLIRSNFGRDD